MLTTRQDFQDFSMGVFTPSTLDWNFLSTDVTPSKPQLADNVDPVQPPISETIDSVSYSESDYDWLVNVLDALIKFISRDEISSIPELEENDYTWVHGLLVELVSAVGDSDIHPLRPLMEFVCQLIDNCEDKYVPELTELFPELAEEALIEITDENSKQSCYTLELSDGELAAHAFFSIGYLLGEGNLFMKALDAYDKAIKLDPKNAKAHYYKGIVKNKLGEYQTAIVDFDKAVKLGFDSIDLYYYRALSKTLLGQHKAAISDFDIVITLNPDCGTAYNYRGNLRQELGQHEDALTDYTEAIRINPDYAEAYNSRSNLRGSCSQFHDALTDCNEAIRLKPDYAEAYANRGLAKVGLNRTDEARSDFHKALELAEQQDRADLKALVENQLEQLKQNSRKPRSGGQ